MWAVATVDEALELLTGLPVADMTARIEAGLDALAARALEFMTKAVAGERNGGAPARRRKAPAT